MSEIKHTPGPWDWVGRDLESNSPTHCEAVIQTGVDCGSYCYGGMPVLQISDADKRLIAASPDLLEALQDLIGWVPSSSHWHTDAPMKTLERARAAIAKATGV